MSDEHIRSGATYAIGDAMIEIRKQQRHLTSNEISLLPHAFFLFVDTIIPQLGMGAVGG